jgi:hypothetical protein
VAAVANATAVTQELVIRLLTENGVLKS